VALLPVEDSNQIGAIGTDGLLDPALGTDLFPILSKVRMVHNLQREVAQPSDRRPGAQTQTGQTSDGIGLTKSELGRC
jgi:hypothetical protein